MKKVLFPILALVLALGLALPAAAHTESDPFVTDLIADGGSVATEIDVGDVSVWNDSTTLYVKYETTGGWEMTETHLAVATEESGIPQNRAGNPKVGQFPDGNYYDPPVSDDTFTFNLDDEGWVPCETDLYIAAHAVVVDTSSMETITIVSEPGVDVSAPQSSYYGLGNPIWGTLNPAVATWAHGSWPSIPGATWISTDYYVEEVVDDSWRWFQDEITIPGYPSGGMVLATADNAEEFYFNGTFVGSHGEVQVPYYDDGEWRTITSYPITPQPGVNSLDFIVRNYAAYSPNIGGTYFGGDPPNPTLNPAGLIYKAEVNYYPDETAWGDGDRFVDRGNWAMYFTYHVQGLEGLVGDWLHDADYQGTHYFHDMTIATQDGGGNLTGTGGYPAGSGPPYAYPYNWTLTGNISGSTVNFTIVYQNGYTASLTGTVASGGDSMSGTWSDSQGQSGKWTATRVP